MAKVLRDTTANQLRRLIADQRTGKGNRPERYRRGQIRKVQRVPGSTRRLPVILTGRTLIAGKTNQWRYNWVEAIWVNLDDEWVAVVGGRTGVAFNSIETANTANGPRGVQSGGVDTAALDVALPSNGLEAVPIRGATDPSWASTNGPCVFLESFIDDEGFPVWHFQAMNAIDGTCPP